MIQELLTEIAVSGWLINNLYQVDGGLWRASLRKPDGEGDWFTTWAEASTIEDVLYDAFGLTESAEFAHTPTVGVSISTMPTDLLSRLGLTRKTPFTDRRL